MATGFPNLIIKVAAGILIVDGGYHIAVKHEDNRDRIFETGLGAGLALL